ncbi:MAG: tyrosine-type recombinase/integrase [PVC group bacterium]|nr:tyrosine-type recombinase/integrase [PVC group bacterium]
MNNIQSYASKADLRKTAWDSLSENTQLSYQYDLKIFTEKYDIINADSDTILDYIKEMKKAGLKNNTINRRISSLSKFYNMQIAVGKRNDNPVQRLKSISKISFKSVPNTNIPLTEEELSYVIKNARPKMSVIIEALSLDTALRISELINIKHSDIEDYDKKNKIVHVCGKGNKEGYVYIDNVLYNKILTVFPRIKETDYLFYTKLKNLYSRKTLWKLITKEFQELIGKHVRPHALRHWWATRQIENGRDIKEVSKYLRHASTATTLDFYVDTALGADEFKIELGGQTCLKEWKD